MTRKEIFFSSSALVALNIVLGIFTYLTQRTFTSFTMFWIELSEWGSVFSQIAFHLGLNEWLSTAIAWILPHISFFCLVRKTFLQTDQKAGASVKMFPPLSFLVLLFGLLLCLPPGVPSLLALALKECLARLSFRADPVPGQDKALLCIYIHGSFSIRKSNIWR